MLHTHPERVALSRLTSERCLTLGRPAAPSSFPLQAFTSPPLRSETPAHLTVLGGRPTGLRPPLTGPLTRAGKCL